MKIFPRLPFESAVLHFISHLRHFSTFYSVQRMLHWLALKAFMPITFSFPISGVTGGGTSAPPPRDFPPGKFCDKSGKMRQGKKEENIEENEENGIGKEENDEKRKGGNEKFKGKKDVKDFFFFFFAFKFQETTENIKGSTKIEISTGKNLKSRREKIR